MEKLDKPTWKSTEFWITLIGVIGGVLMAVFEQPDSNATKIVGAILTAVCGASFSMGRSLVKVNREKSRGLVANKEASEAILAAMKKKA